MALDLILLSALLAAALWTVMSTRLMRAIVGLAFTSVVLSVIIYRLNAPLAAVFELSVCAGLIPVIFLTTISFTARLSKEGAAKRRRERFAQFLYLPFIIIVAGLFLGRYLNLHPLNLPSSLAVQTEDVRSLLWNFRHLDLFGQVIVLLAGVFGVAVLFKEQKK